MTSPLTKKASGVSNICNEEFDLQHYMHTNENITVMHHGCKIEICVFITWIFDRKLYSLI